MKSVSLQVMVLSVGFNNINKLGRVLGKSKKVTLAEEHRIAEQFRLEGTSGAHLI